MRIKINISELDSTQAFSKLDKDVSRTKAVVKSAGEFFSARRESFRSFRGNMLHMLSSSKRESKEEGEEEGEEKAERKIGDSAAEGDESDDDDDDFFGSDEAK